MLSHYGQYQRDRITKRTGGSYEIDAAFPAGDGGPPSLRASAAATAAAPPLLLPAGTPIRRARPRTRYWDDQQ